MHKAIMMSLVCVCVDIEMVQIGSSYTWSHKFLQNLTIRNKLLPYH